MNAKKVAAIWCRVSTHDRWELFLESQELRLESFWRQKGFMSRPFRGQGDYVDETAV